MNTQNSLVSCISFTTFYRAISEQVLRKGIGSILVRVAESKRVFKVVGLVLPD